MTAIDAFLKDNPEEFVIVDIHDLKPAYRETIPLAELTDYIKGVLKDKLLPYEALSLNLSQLKKSFPGQKVIIATAPALGAKEWGWPRIRHQWMGQDIVTAYQLGEFIGRVMESPPSHELWSLSATGYGAIGPTYIERDIDRWYAAGSPYQMKSNIINVDWFDRTQLVKNCIATNIEKGQRKRD